MPKQVFELTDYFGPVIVAIIFAIVLLLLSFFVINWFCVSHKDDLTAFEKFGRKYNFKLGPHSMNEIRRGGFPSTYALEQEKLVRKNTKSYDHA